MIYRYLSKSFLITTGFDLDNRLFEASEVYNITISDLHKNKELLNLIGLLDFKTLREFVDYLDCFYQNKPRLTTNDTLQFFITNEDKKKETSPHLATPPIKLSKKTNFQ